ncbi:hypothetical protein BSV1_I05 (plasmid) [Borreliella finlandensis]|uniref:Uncharacterized protein n=1 Tax=Borreliella finlandensis TaxID=498741 RepID=A0A806CN46_9SPIR|nr:hypothetical protein BSV1_I05 [Borreliella finlandensis]
MVYVLLDSNSLYFGGWLYVLGILLYGLDIEIGIRNSL